MSASPMQVPGSVGRETSSTVGRRPSSPGVEKSEPNAAARFRALKVAGRRRAFVLEQEFWAILEEAAAENGMKLGDYIGQVTSNVPGANQTSALRRSAARWLIDARERSRAEDPAQLAKRVTAAIPNPALVLDDRKRIISHNRCFVALGSAHRSEQALGKADPVHLHLALPVSTLLRQLAEGGEAALRLRYVLDFGAYRSSGLSNVTILDRNRDARLLLCVLEPDRPTQATAGHTARAGAP